MRLASGVSILFAVWLSTMACDSESIGSSKKFDRATSAPYASERAAPPRWSTYTGPKTAQRSSPATPTPKATPKTDMDELVQYNADAWWGLVGTRPNCRGAI